MTPFVTFVIIVVVLVVLNSAANLLSNHRDTWWYRAIVLLSLATSRKGSTHVGFFDAIFRRRTADAPMRMEQAIVLSRQYAITAAEQKLERSLSPDERIGIESIQSLMMMESVCLSFSFPATTAAQVLADIEFFAAEARKTNAD